MRSITGEVKAVLRNNDEYSRRIAYKHLANDGADLTLANYAVDALFDLGYHVGELVRVAYTLAHHEDDVFFAATLQGGSPALAYEGNTPSAPLVLIRLPSLPGAVSRAVEDLAEKYRDSDKIYPEVDPEDPLMDQFLEACNGVLFEAKLLDNSDLVKIFTTSWYKAPSL